MRQLFNPRRVRMLVLLLVLGGGTAAYVLCGALLTNYYLQKLGAASESERDLYVDPIAQLGNQSFSALARALQHDDTPTGQGALLAAPALARRWGAEAIQTRQLMATLIERFATLSDPGQLATLDLVDMQLNSTTADISAYVGVIPAATHSKHSSVKRRALALVEKQLELSKRAELFAHTCELVRACLRDADGSNRLQALRLAPRISRQLALDGVALLMDSSPEVRRVALLALAADADLVGTDDLLRWLHDSDAEVRRLCEQALKGRGLSEAHIRLGRLLTSEQPGTRLLVLEQLRRSQDLDPGIWLRRLSHDPSAAVRAAALRAAVENADVDLSDRIEQMTQNDPSSTVRQLAQFYVKSRKANRSLTFGARP